ncbi:MAG: putative Ig domain-containing protein [Pseudomonadota bacterium]
MGMGPGISLFGTGSGGQNSTTTGAPIAQEAPADIELPVGLFATVLDLGQNFTGDNLVFSLAPASHPLPAGLSFDPTAVLSGTPSEAVSRTLVIRATNAQGFADLAVTIETFALLLEAEVTGLTNNPTHGPSAQTGIPLSATVASFNGPPPGTISYQWKTAQSGAIAGATGASFTPDATGFDAETLYCTLSSAGYPDADTPATTIRHVPPIASGGLDLEIFDQGTGRQTVDAGADIAGQGLSYDVAGLAMVTVDGAGLVSVPTNATADAVVITVTATNSGGSVETSFPVTIEANGIATDARTSVTYDGVTFNFDRAMPVGYYTTGDPFVVADQAFDIISTSPASALTNGAWANGMMVNPAIVGGGSGQQGFDGFLAVSSGSGQQATATAYNSNLNVDPGSTGSDYAIALGDEKTLVKSVRLSSVTNGESWQTIEKYVWLNIVPEAPAVGALPPPPCGSAKPTWNESDWDETTFPDITLPSSWSGKTYAGLDATVPDDIGMYSMDGEKRRRFRLDVATGTTNTNYSSQFYDEYCQWMIWMMSASANTNRTTMIRKAWRHAMQVYGLHLEGFRGGGGISGGAGQDAAYQFYLYWAAVLTQDAILLAAARNMRGSFAQVTWVDDAIVFRAPTIGGQGSGTQTNGIAFSDDHRGLPWSIPDEFGANGDARYIDMSAGSIYYEALVISMMSAGAGSTSGRAAILNGATEYDTNEQTAAILAFMDQKREATPNIGNSDSLGAEDLDIYDTIQTDRGWARFTAQPYPLLYGDNSSHDDDYFSASATAGEIDYDFKSFDWATEAITRRDLRYSLDGYQFIEETDVGNSGTTALGLLRGTSHRVQGRNVSASGHGAWSTNEARAGGATRAVFTLGGSALTATPINTVAPQIVTKFNLQQSTPSDWIPAPNSLTDDEVELAAGVGYYSTGAPTSYAYQWERSDTGTGGWSDISGATSKEYNRTSADAEKFIRCQVTATTSGGSVETATNVVECPALNTLPAGTIFDSNFGPNWVVDGDGFTVVSTGNSNPVHEPGIYIPVSNVHSRGGIRVNKTGSFPFAEIQGFDALTAGTYRCQVQLAALVNGPGDRFTGDCLFRVWAEDESTIWVERRTPSFQSSDVVDYDVEFTVTGSEPELTPSIQIGLSTSTGSTSGGSPIITRLTITKLA